MWGGGVWFGKRGGGTGRVVTGIRALYLSLVPVQDEGVQCKLDANVVLGVVACGAAACVRKGPTSYLEVPVLAVEQFGARRWK